MKSIQLVVWDLDGTLVDSLPTTFAAFNAGLEPFLGRTLTPKEIMGHFGPPDQLILKKLVGERHADDCIQLMLKYLLCNLDCIQPFLGILEVLSELKDQGIQQGIFTGRGRQTTEIILRHLKIEDYFVEVVTNDDVPNHKPAPDGILKVCNIAQVTPANTLMIGDSSSDILAGRAAGARTMSCTWDRHTDLEKLHLHQPDAMIEHPTKLLKILESC